MVFVFDEIKGVGKTFPGFAERKWELNNALLEIAHAAGDEAHRGGSIDYAVRLTTSKWTFEALPAPNAFLLIDNLDNLLVFQRRDSESLELKHRLSVTDDWFMQVCEAFEEFRSDLELSTQTA
jgi:hypothetical protein